MVAKIDKATDHLQCPVTLKSLYLHYRSGYAYQSWQDGD